MSQLTYQASDGRVMGWLVAHLQAGVVFLSTGHSRTKRASPTMSTARLAVFREFDGAGFEVAADRRASRKNTHAIDSSASVPCSGATNPARVRQQLVCG